MNSFPHPSLARPSSGILFYSLTGVSPQNRGASDSDLGVPIIFSGSMLVSFRGESFQKPWLQIDRNTPRPFESPSKIDYRILEVGRVSSPNVSKYSELNVRCAQSNRPESNPRTWCLWPNLMSKPDGSWMHPWGSSWNLLDSLQPLRFQPSNKDCRKNVSSGFIPGEVQYGATFSCSLEPRNHQYTGSLFVPILMLDSMVLGVK